MQIRYFSKTTFNFSVMDKFRFGGLSVEINVIYGIFYVRG